MRICRADGVLERTVRTQKPLLEILDCIIRRHIECGGGLNVMLLDVYSKVQSVYCHGCSLMGI